MNQQASYFPPAHPQPRNGLGTTSLVMGIVSIACAWIPFLGFATYATSITGIITGALGRVRVQKGIATNGGVALGGLVTSIVGLVSVVLATVAYSSLMYAVATSPPTTTPTTLPSEVSTTQTAGPSKSTMAAEKVAKVGDTVVDGDFAFTVKKVRDGVTKVGKPYLSERAQGQFIIVTLTVKNVGDEANYFYSDGAYLLDDAGKRYSADSKATITVDSDNFLEEINPGNTMKGKVVFDVPKNIDLSTLELNDTAHGDGGAQFSLR